MLVMISVTPAYYKDESDDREQSNPYETHLAKTSDGDAMRAVAVEVLDHGVGGVGFERGTIVVVVNGRVLDGNIRGTVNVPTI